MQFRTKLFGYLDKSIKQTAIGRRGEIMNYDCMIVDDEKALLESTSEYLNLFGVKTITVQTAQDCIRIILNNTVKLILLDINLGEDSGFELCKKLRGMTNVPILFISARNSNDDMLLALHIGGDDYIQKPYSLSVLLAKIQVVLKRCYPQTRSEIVKLGNCTANVEEQMLYRAGEIVKLKGMESKLLFYLINNSGRTITKTELFREVWENVITGDNTLNVHIRHLREKMEEDPNNPRLLKTVWGMGYMLILENQE